MEQHAGQVPTIGVQSRYFAWIVQKVRSDERSGKLGNPTAKPAARRIWLDSADPGGRNQYLIVAVLIVLGKGLIET